MHSLARCCAVSNGELFSFLLLVLLVSVILTLIIAVYLNQKPNRIDPHRLHVTPDRSKNECNKNRAKERIKASLEENKSSIYRLHLSIHWSHGRIARAVNLIVSMCILTTLNHFSAEQKQMINSSKYTNNKSYRKFCYVNVILLFYLQCNTFGSFSFSHSHSRSLWLLNAYL